MDNTLPTTDLNFERIFAEYASNSYNWSDANYQLGWDTVASTPPTRQQFNALQNMTDLKLQYLKKCAETVATKVDKNDIKVGEWYAKIGDKILLQYGEGITDANGLVFCQFQYDFPTFEDGNGVYIPVPVVWKDTAQSYNFGVGSGTNNGMHLRTADGVYVYVTDAQTNAPAANVHVGVLAFGLYLDSIGS